MNDLISSADVHDRSGRSLRLLRVLALAVLTFVIIGANILMFRQIDVQLARSYTAETDSTIWNVAQVEVELLRFEIAVHDLLSDPESAAYLKQLRLQFDLLYSRAQIANGSDRLADLPLVASENWQLLVGDDGLINFGLPLVDGKDEALIANLPELLSRSKTIIKTLRPVIVASLISSVELSEGQRNELQSSLQFFSAVALGLMGVMSGMIITIYLQSRARERNRQELAQAVFNLRTTIDSSLEAAIILDHNGRIIGCNRAGAEMLNWSEDDPVPHYLTETLHDLPQGAEGLQKLAKECAEGKGRVLDKGFRADGTPFPIEISVAFARSAAGLPIAIAFLRDISERVERENTLREARNAALKGEEAKSRFLAMISHEIRTPLNGLLSAVELLRAGATLNEKQAGLVRVIENCGKSTLDQVNNVLDLTSLRSVDDKSQPEVEFSLLEMLQGVADQFEADAAARGNEILIKQSGVIPEKVSGRNQLVRRVLVNLVSNAVKFTEDGTITIGVDCQPGRHSGSVAIRLSVADTGIGIDDQDCDRIFKAFETLDSSFSRLQQGSGLGLGLAKLAAESVGGRITVTSKPNHGSTFAFFLTLPVVQAAMKLPPAPESAKLPARALSLLIVEDNVVNRELLAEILRQKGHRITVAENGLEGVNLAAETAFDAILMDISMPVMDGLEATSTIRKGGQSQNVPIIAVTANADSLEQSEFEAYGFTEVMSKPLSITQLEKVLREHVNPVAGPEVSVIDADPSPEKEAAMDTKTRPNAGHLRLVTEEVVEAGADDQAAPTADPELPQLLDEEVIADLQEALGVEYMSKMAARYVSETETAIAALADREAAGDLSGAAQIAHKNAGAAASLGLRAMHRLLVTYENEAKVGDLQAALRTKQQIERIKKDTFDVLRERGLTA